MINNTPTDPSSPNALSETLEEFPADLREYISLAKRLADAAREETLPRFRKAAPISNKAGLWFDPVTDADREGERAMRRIVRLMYPRHGILGEEFGEEFGDDFDQTGNKPEWRWVFDPVDGTRAFVCGVATWTILIALERHEAPVFGVIDQPFTGERWMGAGDYSCYCLRGNEARCMVSGQTDLSKARITTTDPRRTDGYFDSQQADAFRRVASASRVARFSMDGYAYGLLALGEMDIVMESGLAHHDYAALAPVIEGAGGIVSNWRGEPLGTDDRGEILAVASGALHEQVMEIINKT